MNTNYNPSTDSQDFVEILRMGRSTRFILNERTLQFEVIHCARKYSFLHFCDSINSVCLYSVCKRWRIYLLFLLSTISVSLRSLPERQSLMKRAAKYQHSIYYFLKNCKGIACYGNLLDITHYAHPITCANWTLSRAVGICSCNEYSCNEYHVAGWKTNPGKQIFCLFFLFSLLSADTTNHTALESWELSKKSNHTAYWNKFTVS